MSQKVNTRITDAVAQTNVTVLGESPSQALSILYQASAHSTSLSMQNATTTQQQVQNISTAVVATACANILALSKAGKK